MAKEHLIFDAAGCSLGRLASLVARQSLLGNTVDIVNAEKALVSISNLPHYVYKNNYVKTVGWGPLHQKVPHLLVKRTIRGMLPWKQTRGREAYKRIRVYMGVPEALVGKAKLFAPAKAGSEIKKHLTIQELSRRLGVDDK